MRRREFIAGVASTAAWSHSARGKQRAIPTVGNLTQTEENPKMNAPRHPDGEPWQWPEPTWRRITSRARAGRSLRPATWPGGARCAIALSLDADHDTIPLRDAEVRMQEACAGSRRAPDDTMFVRQPPVVGPALHEGTR